MTAAHIGEQRLEAWFRRVVDEQAAGLYPALVRLALTPLSMVYCTVIEIYKVLYRTGILKTVRLPCRVISVGNITMGGVGKTVAVQALARALQAEGVRCVIVSYGFRSANRQDYAVVADRERVLLSAEQAGDEAAMMAGALPGIPVVIGKRRAISGMAAIRLFDPDVILLDDGFQHWRLHRDVDLVLLDAGQPIGNGRVFPLGMLRERPASLRRASALILTRCDLAGDRALAAAHELLGRLAPGRQVLHSSHRPAQFYRVAPPTGAAERMESGPAPGEPVFLVSGIARNDSFLSAAQRAGFQVAGIRAYPDHFGYRTEDVTAILREARGCAAVLTTEKDAVKLAPLWNSDCPLLALPVSLVGISAEQWRELCGLS
ncbi:MAG: tetraacyldisaccharide 4'-kinase [Chloroflexi bacterium]|nr:tetraacyldisaccharide 4'-kinase [Chloroflexota bacterium]